MSSSLHDLSLSRNVVALLGLLFSYIIIGGIVNYRKLSQFKGPPFAGFSRAWMLWQSLNARVNRAEFEAIHKYGSVCRIGPDLLVTGDPDVIRHMNAPGSRWRRSGWYQAMRMDPRQDTVFSTQDEKVHADLKAKEAGGYNGRDIDTLEPDINARITDMMHLIRTRYNGITIDVASVTRFFTLDVLSTVAFGRPFGFMAANEDLWEYNKSSSDFLQILEFSTNHPNLRWLLSTPIVQALAAPKVTDKTGMGPMLKFAREAVAERYGPDAKVKKDMLGHFVSKGLSQTQCEAEAFLQIIAGSDSTTTILRSTLYLLSGNPGAYAKFRAEVDNLVQAGDTSDTIIRYSEAQKLPYLGAILWEGLRMYPPLFSLKSKISPPGGENVGGVFIPEGTEVAICDDAVCRSREIFGDDSNIFRPERWLETDAETHRKYYQAVDTIFGSGRFLCLGKHIAMMELHKTLFELVRQFDWVIADPMRGIDTHAHGVHVQSNMNMMAYPRN